MVRARSRCLIPAISRIRTRLGLFVAEGSCAGHIVRVEPGERLLTYRHCAAGPRSCCVEGSPNPGDRAGLNPAQCPACTVRKGQAKPTASLVAATGCSCCTPSARPPASGRELASLPPTLGNWCSSTAGATSSSSLRIRLRFRSQPCGRRSAHLIRAATMSGSHGEMTPSVCSRSRQVRNGPFRQAGVADQCGHRRERARAVRPGMIGQADEHELAYTRLAGRPGRPGPVPG